MAENLQEKILLGDSFISRLSHVEVFAQLRHSGLRMVWPSESIGRQTHLLRDYDGGVTFTRSREVSIVEDGLTYGYC